MICTSQNFLFRRSLRFCSVPTRPLMPGRYIVGSSPLTPSCSFPFALGVSISYALCSMPYAYLLYLAYALRALALGTQSYRALFPSHLDLRATRSRSRSVHSQPAPRASWSLSPAPLSSAVSVVPASRRYGFGLSLLSHNRCVAA